MGKRVLTIQEFANHFGLILLNGDQNALKREIKENVVNRPGIELAGFFDYAKPNRLIFLGNKEFAFMKTLSEAKIKKAFEFLTSDECPGVVICRNYQCPPILLEIAKKKNFPIFLSPRITNELNLDTVVYLGERLAPTTAVHASLVEIFSMGVLLMGESGIGKSETTLELIKKGHHLISDDRVDISLVRGELFGTAPELLVGMMEVRGIGIIDVPRMFGINALLMKKKISYAIKLVHLKPEEPMERLGNANQYLEVLGQRIPLLYLPVSGARSMAEIIEVAVTNLKLKEFGYDSSYEFEARLNELLGRKI